jgi:hypothetical protein
VALASCARRCFFDLTRGCDYPCHARTSHAIRCHATKGSIVVLCFLISLEPFVAKISVGAAP